MRLHLPARVGRIAIGWAPICLPLLFAIVACVSALDLGTDEQAATVPLQDYSFGNQQVHTASAAHTFTISPASGVQNDTVTAISESCPDFSIAATGLPATVKNVCTGGGSACTGYQATTYQFTATFTPQVTGAVSCVVSVTISGATSTFTLSGTGIEPAVRESVSPASSLDLGQVRVGDTSGAATVLIRNFGSGPQPLNVASVAFDAAGLAAGFAVGGTTGAHVVAANGGSDSHTVTCTPGSAAPLAGTLTITSDDPATPSVAIAVTCTGITSNLAFLPSSPALLNGTQAQKATRVGEPVDIPITLKNTGAAQMTIHSLALDGADLAFVAQPAAETKLSQNQTAAVTLRFAASHAVDQGTLGTLTVTYDSAQTRTINVLGAALDTSMSISPDGDVDLGPVCIGKTASQPFFILKNAPGTYVVSDISAPDAPFSLTGMIPSGSPIAVDTNAVSFTASVAPTAAGALHGGFMVTTDIPNATPHAVALAATALPAGVTPTPTTLDLGTVSVGATSVGQMVTLTNCAEAALTLTQTEIVGDNAGDFAVMAPTTQTIAPGGAAQFVVTLTPSEAGAKVASLQITYDGGVANVPLVGTGTGEIPDDRVPKDSTYYGCSIGGGRGAWPILMIVLGLACGLGAGRRRRT